MGKRVKDVNSKILNLKGPESNLIDNINNLVFEVNSPSKKASLARSGTNNLGKNESTEDQQSKSRNIGKGSLRLAYKHTQMIVGNQEMRFYIGVI